MKRLTFILLLLASVCGSVGVYAAETAASVVGRMSAAVKALGSYEVLFTVHAGDYSGNGRYAVSGGDYNLSLAGVDVFGDGAVRYEVNNAQREITIDTVDTSSHNILVNPAGGLDFIGDEFTSRIVSQNGSAVVVRLTPTDGTAGTIDVTVSTATWLPSKLVYDLNGDSVVVEISGIAATTQRLAAFDASAYNGYEIIDFR